MRCFATLHGLGVLETRLLALTLSRTPAGSRQRPLPGRPVLARRGRRHRSEEHIVGPRSRPSEVDSPEPRGLIPAFERYQRGPNQARSNESGIPNRVTAASSGGEVHDGVSMPRDAGRGWPMALVVRSRALPARGLFMDDPSLPNDRRRGIRRRLLLGIFLVVLLPIGIYGSIEEQMLQGGYSFTRAAVAVAGCILFLIVSALIVVKVEHRDKKRHKSRPK